LQPKKKSPVDTVVLSKKYKCDINRIIRAWKNGKNDYELSQVLGINTIKLMQIRQEIATAHEKERQQNRKRCYSTKTTSQIKLD
jgi:hypothetical protein